ncbi:hypothetical protein BJ742DRAFT_141772 [Cladochytrium replicatum]|nr:hypothetical protein BJ742DRAFT_141772 [Cladochytrium replicatum]
MKRRNRRLDYFSHSFIGESVPPLQRHRHRERSPERAVIPGWMMCIGIAVGSATRRTTTTMTITMITMTTMSTRKTTPRTLQVPSTHLISKARQASNMTTASSMVRIDVSIFRFSFDQIFCSGEYVKPKTVYPNLIANKSRSLTSLIEQRVPPVNTSLTPFLSTASSRVTSVESSYGREIANSISQQLELTPSRRASTLSLSTGSVEWTIPRRHTTDRSEHSERRLSSTDTEKSPPSLRRHKTESHKKHESVDSEQLRVRYAAIRRLSESTISTGSNPTLQRSTMSSRTSGKLRNHTVDWQPRDQDLILDSDSPGESSPTGSIFSRFRKKHRTNEGAMPAGSFSTAKHIPLGKDVREMTPAYLDQDTATVREELILKARETPTPSFSDHTLRGTPIPEAVGLGLPISPSTAQLVPVAPPTMNATLFPVQVPVASFSNANMTTSYNNMVVSQTFPHEFNHGMVNPSFMGMVPAGPMMLAPSNLQNQIIAGTAQNITTATSHIQTAHMVHQTIHIHCSHASGTLLPGAISAATCTCHHEPASPQSKSSSSQNGLRKRLFSNPSKHNVSAVDDVASAIEESQSGSFAEILRSVVEKTQKNDPSLAYSLPVLQDADWNSLTVELKDAIQRQANGRLNERIHKMSISGSQSGPSSLPNAATPIMVTPVTGSYMLVQAMPTPDIVYYAADAESQPQFFPPQGH